MPEIDVLHAPVALQLLRRAGQRDASALDHHCAIGNRKRDVDLLLDDEHGHALPRPILEEFENRRNQRLREPERRLVAQQDGGLGDERLRQREHLLLAAAEIARRGPQLGAQDREELEHLSGKRFEIAAIAAYRGTQPDIVGHAELRKDAVAVEDQAQSLAHVGFGRLPGDVAPVQRHAAASRLDEARDGAHQRRLARAVAAQHQHHLARLHDKVDAVQDGCSSVAGVEAAHLKHRACP